MWQNPTDVTKLKSATLWHLEMSQNVTKCHFFKSLVKATFNFYVWISLGTTLTRWFCSQGSKPIEAPRSLVNLEWDRLVIELKVPGEKTKCLWPPHYCTPPGVQTVPDVIGGQPVLTTYQFTPNRRSCNLVGPQEELRDPSGYTPRGFTLNPKREAK